MALTGNRQKRAAKIRDRLVKLKTNLDRTQQDEAEIKRLATELAELEKPRGKR